MIKRNIEIDRQTEGNRFNDEICVKKDNKFPRVAKELCFIHRCMVTNLINTVYDMYSITFYENLNLGHVSPVDQYKDK